MGVCGEGVRVCAGVCGCLSVGKVSMSLCSVWGCLCGCAGASGSVKVSVREARVCMSVFVVGVWVPVWGQGVSVCAGVCARVSPPEAEGRASVFAVSVSVCGTGGCPRGRAQVSL